MIVDHTAPVSSPVQERRFDYNATKHKAQSAIYFLHRNCGHPVLSRQLERSWRADTNANTGRHGVHHPHTDRRPVVYDPACGCHSDAIRNRDAAAVRADDDRYAHGNADCDANINANAGHAVTAASVHR